jgi:putative ABC transport system permease protein
MNLFENLKLALRGLTSNKMRTGLTMLGIIIGVGVVILVVAIGQGASKNVTDAINSLGTNLLTVRSNPRGIRLTLAGRTATSAAPPNNLTLDDSKVIAKTFRQTVAAVAPSVRGNIQVRFNAKDASTSVTGATVDYPFVNNAGVSAGRWFTNYEDQGCQKVCLVGATVADNVAGSPTADLTGQNITINRETYLIIGMLTSKGSGAFGQDQDDVIIVPITTAMQRILNKTRVDNMSVRCVSPEMMPLAQQQISSLLRARHHIRPPYPQDDDFQINSQTELMARQQSVTTVMTSLLTAVAIISLVVGGIGIMNIMLVSVTERTREIGIRKAIGATPRDVLLQFLIEAAIMAVIGGLMGVVLGVGGSLILDKFGWSTIISPPAIAAALIVSAAIGIFFGIYPASKASKLHPIDALRYE